MKIRGNAFVESFQSVKAFVKAPVEVTFMKSFVEISFLEALPPCKLLP